MYSLEESLLVKNPEDWNGIQELYHAPKKNKKKLQKENKEKVNPPPCLANASAVALVEHKI